MPQGGNTGLVGGGVPTSDERVLSLGNMTSIRSFDPVSGEWRVVVARAGVCGADGGVRLVGRYPCCGCGVHIAVLVGLPGAASSYYATRSRGEGKAST